MSSKPISTLCSVLALVVLAAPAAADLAFVPLAVDREYQGMHVETQLWVSNVSGESKSFATRFVPTNTDGTPADDGSGFSAPITVLAGGTFFVRGLAPAGQVGTLEVDADPGLELVARVVGANVAGFEQVGSTLPVIGSESLFAAGETAHLLGAERSLTSKRTNLGILTLGSEPASCEVKVFRANATQVQQTAVIVSPPFGHRQFDDAMAILDEPVIDHGRFEVTCDQPFFTYTTLFDLLTGGVNVIIPAAGADLTGGTGGGTGGGAGPTECPAGATCHSFPGAFYSPSPSQPVRRIELPVPPADYRQIRLTMNVFHGGWQNPSSGLHNLFWFVKERNVDMVGYLNFRGPNNNSILLRHGYGIPQTQKARVEVPFVAIPGETYGIDYFYDMLNRRITAVITNRGQEVARLTGTTNVGRIEVRPGERFLVDISFQPGVNPNEPATYGWRYEDLTTVFIPE